MNEDIDMKHVRKAKECINIMTGIIYGMRGDLENPGNEKALEELKRYTNILTNLTFLLEPVDYDNALRGSRVPRHEIERLCGKNKKIEYLEKANLAIKKKREAFKARDKGYDPKEQYEEESTAV